MSTEAAATYDGPEDDAPAVEAEAPATPEAAPAPEPEAPAATPEPEAKKPPPLTPEQQEVFDAAIAKKVGKQREAERLAEEERQKRVELEQRLAALEAPVRPDIPKVPDRYDYNSDQEFAQAVQHRDALIAQAVRWDANQAYAKQQREQAELDAQRRQQQQLAEAAQTYDKKAEVLGITPQELQQAGAALVQFGIPDNLAGRILRDDRGPEITTYLAKNVVELDALVRMDPMDAAVHLETVIKPKAKRVAPTPPPPPPSSPGGAGFPEGQRGPAGAIYE